MCIKSLFSKQQVLLFVFLLASISDISFAQNVLVGAENTETYFPLIKNKKIALVANQTSQIKGEHLLDFLLKQGFDIRKIFAPEHGFRGKADAGEKIKDNIDAKTGLPIISLYGKKKAPSAEDLKGIDMVVFDIQDVGIRFYTYISTLHYIMKACAENNIPLIVLDRPNPHFNYIDGPVLEKEYQSFVGMHPVPVVYGMTIGEYAQMIKGEKWLGDNINLDLHVIPCQNLSRKDQYILPIKPSPNLPNQLSILLYPSLCFFEGTTVSVGRGTLFPFQVFGHPDLKGDFSFTPKSINGMSKHPKWENQVCYGMDLRKMDINKLFREKKLNLAFLISAYQQLKTGKEKFFNPFFTKLAGTKKLQEQIESGLGVEEIRNSWKNELRKFDQIRRKYLIY